MSQYLDRIVDGVLMFVEDAGALLPAFVIVEGAGAVTGATFTVSVTFVKDDDSWIPVP